MSLRLQRLILILLTLIILGIALLLILFNTKQNIVFFYTPTELLEKNISLNKKVRIGGYVKQTSFIEKSLNNYEFKITDNVNEVLIYYKGILPDLFAENAGVVVRGNLTPEGDFLAIEVLAKHDENYMPPEVAKLLDSKE